MLAAQMPAMPGMPGVIGTPIISAKRLLRAIEHFDGADEISKLRRFVQLARKEVAGPWHGEFHDLGSRRWQDRRPISPLGEMFRTYMPHLIGMGVRPSVEPDGIGERGAAKMLELRLAQAFKDCDYDRHDYDMVASAILGVGIMYVGYRGPMQEASAVDTTGSEEPGSPFVQSIDIERFIPDASATHWHAGTMFAHWTQVDREQLMAQGYGNPEVLKDIPNVWEDAVLEQYHRGGRVQVADGRDQEWYLDDRIWLIECCFAKAGKWYSCVLPPWDGADEFVVPPQEIVNEPEGHRYVFCGLSKLPGMAQPHSPAMAKMDIHLGKAGAAAKLLNQIEVTNRKVVGAEGAQEAVDRIMDLDKPEDVVFADPSTVTEIVTGGMVKELVEGYSFLDALDQTIGANVAQAGGSKDVSDTATGASILAGNAGVVLGHLRDQVEQARVKVMQRVSAMLLASGDKRTLTMTGPGGVQIPLEWDAESLDISWQSMKYRVRTSKPADAMPPAQEIDALFKIMLALPQVLPVFQALGADPGKVMDELADQSGIAMLSRLIPTSSNAAVAVQTLQLMSQAGQAAVGGPAAGVPGSPVNAAASQAAPRTAPVGPPTLPAPGM